MAPRRKYQSQPYEPGSAPPPPGDEEDRGGGPIGVPDDYPIPGGVTPQGVPPRLGGEIGVNSPGGYGEGMPGTRYNDGDELIPANYSADRIVEIQMNLERVGLLAPGGFSLGIWDPATQRAYYDLLGLANARGQTAEQTLNEYIAIVEAGGGPLSEQAGGPPPLTTQTTPPEELEPVFRRAAIELTGRGWDQAQIRSAIAAYNQVEVQRQTEAYNAQYSATGYGPGGNVQAAPSPEAFIESRIQSEDPEGVAGETGLSFINEFMDVVRGSSWGGGQ